MSLADIKARARRGIHGRLAVSCLYKDQDHPDGLDLGVDATVGLTVRFHNKIDRNGDLDGDYSEIIEGIDKLVFLDENVAEVSAALVANGEPPLTLSRTGVVTIPEYKGIIFALDSEEVADGPAETLWLVARKRG